MSPSGAETSVIVLVVSVLVGGFAIHVGSMFAFKTKDYGHAVVTAVLGAIAWAIVHYVLAALAAPGALSSLVALVVWIWVVKWRYGVGWVRAAVIGLFAWIAALGALTILAALGVEQLGAYGVPGV